MPVAKKPVKKASGVKAAVKKGMKQAGAKKC